MIDWSRDAASIHNLVRAVAPRIRRQHAGGGCPARILRTRSCPTPTRARRRGVAVSMAIACSPAAESGGTLAVQDIEIDGVRQDAVALAERFGAQRIALGR